jgi:hypothetical protein
MSLIRGPNEPSEPETLFFGFNARQLYRRRMADLEDQGAGAIWWKDRLNRAITAELVDPPVIDYPEQTH